MKKVIGIISYLPDDLNLREIRKNKLMKLLIQCDRIFNLPIIIIAQNWKFELNKPNTEVFYYDKLGITGARKELRNKFLESDYEYLIMLDDDSELFGDYSGGQDYLKQIEEHPDMYGIYYKNLLKLFAISKYMFNKIDYPDAQPEYGEILEDMWLTMALDKLYPEKRFNFRRDKLIEKSDSHRDENSTWYHDQFNKHEIGNRTRELIDKLKIPNNNELNIFYFNRLNCVGGVESFFYYIAKTFHNQYNIQFYYGPNSDKAQIDKISQYCDCHLYNGTKLKCKRLFVQYAGNDKIIENVTADEYIEVIHADYTNISLHTLNPKITKYIGVSDLASEAFTNKTGIPCETFYIPVNINEQQEALRLISATRLRDRQKGKQRIELLANRLNERKIPYVWLIFTDDVDIIDNPNIAYMKPNLNIIPYIKSSDYLVQLSDRESYCLSMIESWSVGTPVVTTNIPILKETGATKDNSIIMNLDCSNIDEVIDKMLIKKNKFNYKAKQSDWTKILNG